MVRLQPAGRASRPRHRPAVFVVERRPWSTPHLPAAMGHIRRGSKVSKPIQGQRRGAPPPSAGGLPVISAAVTVGHDADPVPGLTRDQSLLARPRSPLAPSRILDADRPAAATRHGSRPFRDRALPSGLSRLDHPDACCPDGDAPTASPALSGRRRWIESPMLRCRGSRRGKGCFTIGSAPRYGPRCPGRSAGHQRAVTPWRMTKSSSP